MRKVNLGDEVKDKISGFIGIAVSRSEWLYNCVRIQVQPQGLHEGKPIEVQHYDEDQLEVITPGKCAFVSEEVKPVATGGDRTMRDNRHQVKR